MLWRVCLRSLLMLLHLVVADRCGRHGSCGCGCGGGCECCGVAALSILLFCVARRVGIFVVVVVFICIICSGGCCVFHLVGTTVVVTHC